MTFTLERNCVEKYLEVLQCSVTAPERPLAFTLKESVIQEHNHLMTHYRTKFNDIVQAYQLKATPTKHKRSIDEVLKSITIVSHLYGIFSSPWETRKLKKHVEELQARFQSFADRITAFAKSTSSTQEELLEVLYHTTDQIHAELEYVDCSLRSIATTIVFQNTLRQSQQEVETLLFALTQGKLEAEVGQILEMDVVKTIVKSSRQLNNTIYATHPELLFRVGRMVLTAFIETPENYNFHFVLATPNLRRNTLHQMYEVIQVPITNKDPDESMCMKVHLPSTIFKVDDKFYTADLSDCIKHNTLLVCVQDMADQFSPNFKEIRCLNGNISECEMHLASCEPEMKFTKAGALVFSNS